MQTLSIELPDALNAQLLAFASRQGASEEQVVREALQEYLKRQEALPVPGSFAELIAILDLPADHTAPTDLSSNKAHMKGYGRDENRHR